MDNPADRNRSIRLEVWRELERALNQAVQPAFRGTVAVEVSAKDGRLAEPKITVVRFVRETT